MLQFVSTKVHWSSVTYHLLFCYNTPSKRQQLNSYYTETGASLSPVRSFGTLCQWNSISRKLNLTHFSGC